MLSLRSACATYYVPGQSWLHKQGHATSKGNKQSQTWYKQIPTPGMRMGKNHESEGSLGYEETMSENKNTTPQLKKILKDLPNYFPKWLYPHSH